VPQSRPEAIHEEAAYFARWLSDPWNNIGFRNEQEKQTVIGYRMVDMIVQNEPSGRVSRNSGERNSHILGVARRLDQRHGLRAPVAAASIRARSVAEAGRGFLLR
jgi:hypothetical protein